MDGPVPDYRKVRRITEELCEKSLSKSTVSELCKALDPVVSEWNERSPKQKRFPFVVSDAMLLKIRQQGRVVPQSALIAVGVNEEGYGEVLGLMIGDSAKLRLMFNAPDIQAARDLLVDIVSKCAQKAPRAVSCLEAGFDDAMAVFVVPEPHQEGQSFKKT